MRIRSNVALAAALAWLAGCQPPAQDWRLHEEFCLRHLAGSLGPEARANIRLSVLDAWRLDGRRLMLTGSFRSPVGSMRSAVLLSDDNGRSWRQADAWMAGCESATAFVLDARRAWVVVNWSIEGRLPPYFVFRTADGGQTWAPSAQAISPLEGVPELDRLAFRDAREGEIAFRCEAFRELTFVTHDGGASWQFAREDRKPPRPFAPETFRKGDLRVATDYDKGLILIQECQAPEPWRTLGALPSTWRMKELRFEPCTQPAGAAAREHPHGDEAFDLYRVHGRD